MMTDAEQTLRLECLRLVGDEPTSADRVNRARTLYDFVVGESDRDKLAELLKSVAASIRDKDHAAYDKDTALFAIMDDVRTAFRNAGLSESDVFDCTRRPFR